MFCFENKYINIKNLLTKPKKGGIPAKDNNNKTKNKEINGKLPKNLSSFKVLIYFISNIKNIKNIFIRRYIYTNILNNIKENEYSFKYSKKKLGIKLYI